MKKSRISEGEIFKILKSSETGIAISEVCRTHKISQSTFYKWRSKYGGMELSMIKKMKSLEIENKRLKKMYAEVCIDKEILQEVIEKKL